MSALVIGGCIFSGLWAVKTGVVTVSPDEIAAHEFLGRYKGVLHSGLHFLMPGSKVIKISTRITENKVTCETKSKDNVFVQIHIAVQQEVHRDHSFEAIYKLANPSQQIEAFVADVVRSHAPRMNLDELFEAKESIALEVKDRLSKVMQSYGYMIRQVLVTDVNPDDQVRAAMNEINRSKRLRQAAEEKAEADKLVVVKAAEGEAERKYLQGQGMARSRAAVIEGLKAAVSSDGKAAMRPKDITDLLLMTQYLDTIDKMAQGPANTVFVQQGTDTKFMQAGALPIRTNVIQR